jgi:hypothetical protein
VAIERKIGELRAWQAVLVHELDKINAHRSDASRTLGEWLQAHLDVNKETARALVVAGRKCSGEGAPVQADLADRVSFDRAVATHRLMATGLSADDARETKRMNLEDVRKLTAQRGRMNAVDEERSFQERHVKLQPTLDESAWTLSGRLPGVMGRVVDKALSQKADELRLLVTGGETSTRAQRQADALVMMLQDALGTETGHADDAGQQSGSSGHVTVFVDATAGAAVQGHDVSARIPFGPSVGPNVLEALLCGGTVRVVGMDGDQPVATSNASRAIPPATRDAVLFRDDGCTIDGCNSRYRLEPHHIIGYADGGPHEPDNLTTLCWYHHHVTIHGNGWQIDPTSPRSRRRLEPRSRRAPP